MKKGMTVRSIAALYMASPEWHRLSEASRRLYRGAMKDLKKFMDMDANKVTRPMVIDFKDELYDKPARCRMAIIVLNNIFSYGYDRGHCDHNHAGHMKHMPGTKPIPRWTDEECNLFITQSPDYLRRAFMLALYTGQRRSDIIRMKWDQYDGQTITLSQKKTGKYLKLPVHPLLKAELDQMKKEKVSIPMGRKKNAPSPYIIHNYYGQPWAAVSLTMAISRQCKQLGIKDRVLHGLRKTTAAKLAELGLSPHAIASITGHESLKEIMNYTAEADQVRMAKEAMERWAADGRTSAAMVDGP